MLSSFMRSQAKSQLRFIIACIATTLVQFLPRFNTTCQSCKLKAFDHLISIYIFALSMCTLDIAEGTTNGWKLIGPKPLTVALMVGFKLNHVAPSIVAPRTASVETTIDGLVSSFEAHDSYCALSFSLVKSCLRKQIVHWQSRCGCLYTVSHKKKCAIPQSIYVGRFVQSTYWEASGKHYSPSFVPGICHALCSGLIEPNWPCCTSTAFTCISLE